MVSSSDYTLTMEYTRRAVEFVNVFILIVFLWILPNISCLPVLPQTTPVHLNKQYHLPDHPDYIQHNRGLTTVHSSDVSSGYVARKLDAKKPGAYFPLMMHSKPHSAKPASSNTLQNLSKHINKQSESTRHSKNLNVGGLNTTGDQQSAPYAQQTNLKTEDNKNATDVRFLSSHIGEITENRASLQLAVKSDLSGQGHTEVHEVVLMVGTALAALCTLGVIFGIFSCCCRKKAQSNDENKEENDQLTTQEVTPSKNEDLEVKDKRSLADSQKPSQILNPSDLPPGEKDLDEISFKDKIKAFENSKLILQLTPDKRKSQLCPEPLATQPSPDKPANRLSQHSTEQTENQRNSYVESNFENSATVQIRTTKQPKILVSDEDVDMRDKSRSSGDIISKSDTQDDISDQIFDDVSMHSSISMPNNPDVVIADSDDEEQFAELQRGTVILKSFQRAKPPRNRSPATRTSKGKIRKPRPNATPRKPADKQEVTTEKDSVSTQPGSSAPETPGTSNLKKSEPKAEKIQQKSNSLDKSTVLIAGEQEETVKAMSKSMDFADFDSVMNKSITSIGSDIVTPIKRERNGKYAKNKDSPKRERKESPARFVKTNDKDTSDKEKRTESPSRFKKNSPVNKRHNRKKENDKQQNRLSSDISEDKPVENPSVSNRLSGLPPNASNNIFFLIDPTVKNKFKSVGNIVDDKRKSGDYSAKAKKKGETESAQHEGAAMRRERTYSDPNRKSGEIDSSHV